VAGRGLAGGGKVAGGGKGHRWSTVGVGGDLGIFKDIFRFFLYLEIFRVFKNILTCGTQS
jgi:hypothetical protein